MTDILAENLSGKTIITKAGSELGILYNITMNMRSGNLGHLKVDPEDRSPSVEYEVNEHGHLLVPVTDVVAVKDHIVVEP